MSATLIGRNVWEGERDDEGYRTWTVQHKVRTSAKEDGPQVVMDCAGLPAIGSSYSSLTSSNDLDTFAYCMPSMRVAMLESNDDNTHTWIVIQRFTTRPMIRCNTVPVGNPILEPMKWGGSFVRYLKQATHDRYNLPILSSSWELFVGKEVEFEEAYPTVWIEQNVSNLELSNFSAKVNNVNDRLLWGMNPRCVKLSNVTWARNVYGTCSYYYTRRFEFDINFRTFDRIIQDKGTKVLNGHFGSNTASGCTIDITALGRFGDITGFGINAGGTGYGASKIITLAVTGGTGTGASVTVQTNGSGVVTTAVSVSNGGVDYVETDSALSTEPSGWILDNINGLPPNYLNPQHFIRYKDRNGECTPVILDGRGQPAIGRYPGYRLVEKYEESNLLLLGLPTTL